MQKIIVLVALLWLNVTFSQNQLPLIPMPKEIEIGKKNFILNENTVINANKNSFEAKYLQTIIKEQFDLNLKISQNSKATSKINLSTNVPDAKNFEKESYYLSVDDKRIEIQAISQQGIFYGIQTLIQLFPIEKTPIISIMGVQIFDTPKFSWRGMHLDVSRHFFSKEFVKKYIDYLAMYKMNTFHWHLTDDQGWRIEIKKYPKLTKIGAWRNGSMVGHYTNNTYDNVQYGGFYTQKDIKEVVAYAKQRHITVVPEIEMPGHAVAALASYPELACTKGPFEVAKQWGVLDDVFCPKESTFTFLENVLSEVIALFPSKYIHIGGDECPKTRWKSCPNCQQLMKEKNLKDEHQLQSYFIQKIEKFVNSKGRKIIGWDEILEGGLAPNAAVMSWRGTQGGIDAAKQKHYVVMTPGSHCYFDHYQGNSKNEPVAIGGYTNLEKVYSLNPIPSELTLEESKYIMGAQANLWAEYIKTPQHVEYMLFPRLLALSEAVWGTSNPSEYKNFENRVVQQFDKLDKKGINYSKAIFEINSSVAPSNNTFGVLYSLTSAKPKIKYTVDGTNPTFSSMTYTEPILIQQSQTIKAAYFEDTVQKSTTIEQQFYFSKSTGRKIWLKNQPHENYSAGGSFTLIDAMKGNPEKYGRDWIGFWGNDLEATIDLGKIEKVTNVATNFLMNEGSWIYFPSKYEVWISNDNTNFTKVIEVSKEEIQKNQGVVICKNLNIEVQYVKVIAKNAGKIPNGKAGAGSDSWLFVDEITIE